MSPRWKICPQSEGTRKRALNRGTMLFKSPVIDHSNSDSKVLIWIRTQLAWIEQSLWSVWRSLNHLDTWLGFLSWGFLKGINKLTCFYGIELWTLGWRHFWLLCSRHFNQWVLSYLETLRPLVAPSLHLGSPQPRAFGSLHNLELLVSIM